jgi:hypothetical protein
VKKLAIDPATAKILVQAAIKVVTDEEARHRMFILILAPIIGLILLIAMILYLITSPLSSVQKGLTGNDISVVQKFQTDYGYNQVVGVDEEDYKESEGQDYSGLIITDGSMKVVYYNQADVQWNDALYGSSDKIGTDGCGPTALAMVVSSLTDKMVNPKEMADWAYKNGYWCPGNGSYYSLIPNGAKAFGLKVESIGVDDPSKLIDAISHKKLVIAYMAKGHFTNSGSFIVLRGITKDGKILVADPISVSRSKQEWDLSIILGEARHGVSDGGPLWAIS